MCHEAGLRDPRPSATREQILAAQQALKIYGVEVAAYCKCIQEEGGNEVALKQRESEK